MTVASLIAVNESNGLGSFCFEYKNPVAKAVPTAAAPAANFKFEDFGGIFDDENARHLEQETIDFSIGNLVLKRNILNFKLCKSFGSYFDQGIKT
jgi:hypothetical protein